MTAGDRHLVARLQRERRRRARRRTDTGVWFWVSCGIIAGVFLWGPVGAVLAPPDEPVDSGLLAAAVRDAPTVWAGLLALAIATGLRVGSRGGPLAIDQPFVVHVLLSPVRRVDALAGPAWRAVRLAVGGGGAVGLLLGFILGETARSQRLQWVLGGLVVGLAGGAVWAGAALVGASRRIDPRTATVLTAALVGWVAVDAVTSGITCPLTWLGSAATPGADTVRVALGAVAAVAAAAFAVAGVMTAGGIEIEASARRARLLRSMAFAAGMNDLRTAVVVRRALAHEEPLEVPRWRWGPRQGRWLVAWQRGLRGVARWPGVRWRRLGTTSVVAGALLAAAWRERAIHLVVPAVLMLAAFDTTEPLAQEGDHPWRLQGVRSSPERLALTHLPLAVALQLPVFVGAVVVAGVLGLPSDALGALVAGAPALVVMPVLLAARQAVEELQPLVSPERGQGAPEAAAVSAAMKVLGPVLQVGVGLLPVVLTSLRTLPDEWAQNAAAYAPSAAVGAAAFTVASIGYFIRVAGSSARIHAG